jgi:hypothetical protein
VVEVAGVKLPAKMRPALDTMLEVEAELRRPGPKIDEELAEKVLTLASMGIPVTSIVELEGMPSYSQILAYRHRHPDFDMRLMRAQEMLAHRLIDETILIADQPPASGVPWQHTKLRIEARQFAASKLLPRVYGFDVEATPAAPATLNAAASAMSVEAQRKLAELLERKPSVVVEVTGEEISGGPLAGDGVEEAPPGEGGSGGAVEGFAGTFEGGGPEASGAGSSDALSVDLGEAGGGEAEGVGSGPHPDDGFWRTSRWLRVGRRRDTT